MSRHSALGLAWFTWIVFVVFAVVTLLLQMKNTPSVWLSNSIDALILLAFATVGLLIASRRPGNPIGWIFCASALSWILGTLGEEYAVFALFTAPGSLPAGAVLGVFGEAIAGIAWFLTLTFLLLLFPDGHLLSSRWRTLAWLIVLLLIAWTISSLLAPYGSNVNTRLATVRNPLAVPFAPDLLTALTNISPLVLFLTVLASIVAVVLRFRRARGVERQQMKWLAYGMALTTLLIIVIVIQVILPVPVVIGAPFFYLAIVCIPISAGIAILRYRLFDIDLLINLTLVYGLLTATLLAVYLVLVFGGQHLLSSFFGPHNAVVLVVSTVLVFALFAPLRQRVQQLVDRRFYRSKYDAAKVVARFSERLRQEVNLEQLSSQLLRVVQDTVQPAHISLWLRPLEWHTRELSHHLEPHGLASTNQAEAAMLDHDR